MFLLILSAQKIVRFRLASILSEQEFKKGRGKGNGCFGATYLRQWRKRFVSLSADVTVDDILVT